MRRYRLEHIRIQTRTHTPGLNSGLNSSTRFHRYLNQTLLRNTLVRLGQDVCKSPEEFKAWSQNLGHEKVLTTFRSYGEVACQRQGEILRGLATPQQPAQSNANQIVEALFRKFRDSGASVQGL